jgi:hypothetical protein
VDRVGETHVCRDFERAWDSNTESWLGWYHFLKEGRIPSESFPFLFAPHSFPLVESSLLVAIPSLNFD